MDSQVTSRIMQSVSNRRTQGFVIGAVILVIVAVLQVNNLKPKTPMQELLVNSNLCKSDLQRIQVALSLSGKANYQVKNNLVLVPVAEHAQYLKAVAEHDAIPEDLRREADQTGTSVSPFLMTRPQQLALERDRKKQEIRTMVLRLPFVEQAWFEMDKAASHSAFEQAKQSAVVSIRTHDNVTLSDQHVDTVKMMIGGALAGINPDSIVVIDLGGGFAHQNLGDSETNQQVKFRRVAFEKQRTYENKIREILKQYPGLEISVTVFMAPSTDNQTAAFERRIPAAAQEPVQPKPQAGANSTASIENFSTPTSPQPRTVQLVAHSTDAITTHVETVSVSIDVPQDLVHELFGVPAIPANLTAKRSDVQAAMLKDTQEKFSQLQSEIIEKIRPVLPRSSFANAAQSPITVNLIRKPLEAIVPWTVKAREIATQNWPSAAVLVIGLMLLTIVTRKPGYVPAENETVDADGDIVSINSRASEEYASDPNHEVRLTKLIEKDPDAAAKVIQAWIRDAA
ncbi:MAG: hypothetical protein ACI87E_001003 [Mariniblastus sp.]|jgi:hypothetical protein